ncbi:beta-galactosidase [Herbiconiux sp. VKM Ac-2851]|uniref:beta-galactosidase n=1 Tax=Herbiconiux sp. VKM Ac-2851 TaxID=2739025 RepID=UPI001563F059|nr:beta-galactosidase [Herbiconiux sp. VKM Ac-2851]NQX35128.1 beta-galactosidase [Herbiconiux sp. VKM Ac-2851]
MSIAHRPVATELALTHRPWAQPLTVPAMSNEVDRHDRVRLTSRYLERDGVPVIPVTGELHYSRVSRHDWRERLLLMKSGGVTAVASYVFWIHHEETRGDIRFDGDRDLRAFVELCAEIGLDFVLRLGPWCHGEARNGGFPDWVQDAPVALRTDDPEYLALVRPWFQRLADELSGLFVEDGPIIAIQIENELYDQPQHIATLKRIARDAGMRAPIWTATGWGGASLPDEVVMPLFGGYGDGFWVSWDAPWDITFREHFFSSHVWDDPGIGADLRQHAGIGGESADAVELRTPSALFPAATCELGGGMVTAYQRRPRVAGLDVAAIAQNKIGNGSAWQGYYMYAGGINPPGRLGLQESHATNYPNDLPRFDYDFGAPIGATGRLAESHAHLRRQHAFLEAFGSLLAPMPSSLPDEMPHDVDDVETMRWAVRSDGTTAFVFISRHQPFVPMPDYDDARFSIDLGDRRVAFPDVPITIPTGTLARWPVGLDVGGVTVDWATATALTVLEGDVPTLVLTAEPGIVPRLAFGSSARIDAAPGVTVADGGVAVVDTTEPAVLRVTDGGHRLDVLVIPARLTDRLWVLGAGEHRSLLLSADPLWADPLWADPLWADGESLAGRFEAAGPAVERYEPGSRRFGPVEAEITAPSFGPVELRFEVRTQSQTPPAGYGEYDGRASAPDDDAFEQHAALFELPLPSWAVEGGELEVAWAGDVARLLVDGVVVGDQFWSGAPWIIDLARLDLRPASVVELQVLPLHQDARVGLPRDADRRRRADGRALCAVDSVSAVRRGSWRERPTR